MAFLCVLSFLTYYDRNCITQVQGAIQADLRLSDSQLSWVFWAFWFTYALFEIPGGWLCDRFGPRVTLVRIVLAWSLFTALTGFATGFLSLIAFRLLFGMGEAGAYPSMARVQSSWLSAFSRARAGGLLWLTARWGAAFAPVIMGWIIAVFDAASTRWLLSVVGLGEVSSWRFGFFVSGLFGLVWVVFFWRFFRDDPATDVRVNAAELVVIRSGGATASGAKAHTDHSLRAIGQVFTSRSLWAIALLYLCGSFGWSFFVSWLPRYMNDVHHVPFKQSGWSAAMPLLFAGVACLVGGLLSDGLVKWTGRRRLGRAILPMFGYLTAAAAMIGVTVTKTPEQATVLLCVAAFTYDLGQGANWASIVDIGGKFAGIAAGFINMVGNMSNAFQPPLGRWIFAEYGWPTLFGVYAAAFCGAALMWLFIDPTKRFYTDEPEVRGFEVGPAKA